MTRLLFFILAIALLQGSYAVAQEKTLTRNSGFSKQPTNQPQDAKKERQRFNEIVIASFKATHDGYSSDEVILNDDLNKQFLKACQAELPDANPFDLNWRLMNLRKAGKLKVKSTKRNRSSVVAVSHVAEIAARTMHDKHSKSSDQIMSDPTLRNEFNEIARSVDSKVDLYRVRKSAFQLRKARKLRPELITRIADWDRVIKSHLASEIAGQPDLIPEHPGIYIFRDKTGYLYIGQTDDLRERLKIHLDQSHNLSLAKYLGETKLSKVTIEIHSFAPDSRAKETMVRRAYESELIASRKPKFNIQP